MTRTKTTSGERAVLLEVSRGTGIALTPDGRFIRVRTGPYDQEGQEIALDGQDETTLERRPARRAFGLGWAFRPGFAAALACLLCLVVLSPFAAQRVLASGDPVAFVSLDINPSVEFGVNRWDRVVAARAINADGETVLAVLEWRGRPVAEVVDGAGAAAVALGYLAGGQAEVVVAAVPATAGGSLPPGLAGDLERIRQGLGERMKACLAGASGGSGGVQITVETVLADTAAVREQADKLGISVGKYAVLLTAQEAGLDLEPDDARQGLGRAILDAGGHPGQVLHDAHLVREVSKLAKKFEKQNGLGGDDEHGGSGEDASQGGSGAGSSGGSATPGDTGAGDKGNGHGQGTTGGQRNGEGHDSGGPGGNGSGGPDSGRGQGVSPGEESEGGHEGDSSEKEDESGVVPGDTGALAPHAGLLPSGGTISITGAPGSGSGEEPDDGNASGPTGWRLSCGIGLPC